MFSLFCLLRDRLLLVCVCCNAIAVLTIEIYSRVAYSGVWRNKTFEASINSDLLDGDRTLQVACFCQTTLKWDTRFACDNTITAPFVGSFQESPLFALVHAVTWLCFFNYFCPKKLPPYLINYIVRGAICIGFL